MGIETLEICEWHDVTMKTHTILEPSWNQIYDALISLNEDNFNDIYLLPYKNDPETYLTIGGGNGRYLVTGSRNNVEFPTLVNGTSEEEVSLVVGGQRGSYPKKAVVELECALHATKAFYDAGGFNCGVNWIEL